MAISTPTATWTAPSWRHSHLVISLRHTQTARSAWHDAIFKSTCSGLAFSGAAAFAGLGTKSGRRRVDCLDKEEGHGMSATSTPPCPSHPQRHRFTVELHSGHRGSNVPARSSSRAKIGVPQQVPLQANILAEQLAIVTERALEAERKAQDLVQEVARERARALRAAEARDAAQVEAEQFRSQHVVAEHRACSLRDELLVMEQLNREQRAKLQVEAHETAMADESRRLEGLEAEARRLEARAVQAERKNTEFESRLKDKSLALLEMQQKIDLTEDKASGLHALAEETKATAARRIETLEQQVAEARAMKMQAELALAAEQSRGNSVAEDLEQNLQANAEQKKLYQAQIAAAAAQQEEYKGQMMAALANRKELDMQLQARRLELLDMQQRLSEAEDAMRIHIGADAQSAEKAASPTTVMEPASQISEQVVVPVCEAHEVPPAGMESLHDESSRSEAGAADMELVHETAASSEAPAAEVELPVGEVTTVEIKLPNDKDETNEVVVPVFEAHEVPPAGTESPHDESSRSEAGAADMDLVHETAASSEAPAAEVELAVGEVTTVEIKLPDDKDETNDVPSAEMTLPADEVPPAGKEPPHEETEKDEEATETAGSIASSEQGMTQDSLDEAARLKAIIADMEQTLREEAGFSDEDILNDPDMSAHREALKRLRLENLPSYHRWAMDQGVWQPRTEKEAITMRKRRKMLQRKGMLGPCIANQDRGKRQKDERAQHKQWVKTKRKQKLLAKRHSRDAELGLPAELNDA